MSKGARRWYSEEFKADAEHLIEEQGYGVSEAARRVGVERSIWLDGDASTASGLTAVARTV